MHIQAQWSSGPSQEPLGSMPGFSLSVKSSLAVNLWHGCHEAADVAVTTKLFCIAVQHTIILENKDQLFQCLVSMNKGIYLFSWGAYFHRVLINTCNVLAACSCVGMD